MYRLQPRRRWTGAHPGPDALAAYNDAQLGIFGIGISDVIGVAGGIIGGGEDNTGRLAANQRWYTAALGGIEIAGRYLKQRSGRFGEVYLPAAPEIGSNGGGMIGGWGTATARDDAFQKYQGLVQALTQAGQDAAPPLTYPGATVTSPPRYPTAAAPAPTIAGINPLLIGGLVIGGIMLAGGRRR